MMDQPLPAAKDPARTPDGKFRKGYSGNDRGRPKRFATLFKHAAAGAPSDVERRRVAATLGIQVTQVPEFETRAELLWWQTEMAAFSGDRDARAAVLDRLAGKQSRIEVTGADGGPVETRRARGDGDMEELQSVLEGE